MRPETPPAQHTTKLSPWPVLALGALLYVAWVLEIILLSDIDPLISYVSELSARDQPWSSLFRTTDALAGLVTTLGAVLALRLPRSRWPRLGAVGWGALAGFGLATFADAFFPMACAPTVDALCASQEKAGNLGLSHTVHTFTSVSAGLLLLGAVVALSLLGVRAAARRAVPLVVLGAVVVIGFIWTLIEVAAITLDAERSGLLGLAQRVQLGAASAWIVVLALLLRWRYRTPVSSRAAASG